MAFGNHLGAVLGEEALPYLFAPGWGNIVAEATEDMELEVPYIEIGRVSEKPVVACAGMELSVDEMLSAWKAPLEKVFPTDSGAEKKEPPDFPLSGQGRVRLLP